MSRSLTALALACATATPLTAAAADLDNIGALAQAEFRLLSEDLGAALSYKPILPAEPLGLTGFDIGLEATVVNLENAAVLSTATNGDITDTLVIPKLHVHKGLPLGIDVGAFYAAVPDSNISLWGAELRYAILKGSTTTPALALRASYSALEGVDQLQLNTTGLDLSISKGFAFVTPYAGIGRVWVNSTPDASIPVLRKEEFSVNKLFAGVNLNFAVLNLAVEADQTGETTSYGLKVGWRF
jgi:hypothetical protein